MTFAGTWIKLNHHSQQTNTRTENQTPHILTHRRVMKNENTWTQGGKHYTLRSIGGNRGGTAVGELGRDSVGRNARCGWRGGRQQITLPRVYLCNYLACSTHVPQNLKCNKKKIKKLISWKQRVEWWLPEAGNGTGEERIKTGWLMSTKTQLKRRNKL